MDKSKIVSEYELELMRLVKLVEERPCIWDKYCTKAVGDRKRAWKEICEALTPLYAEMELEDQAKIENHLSSKWQNLRDTFIRMAKKNTQQSYKYYENLKFLMKNVNYNRERDPAEQNERPYLPKYKKKLSSVFRLSPHKRKHQRKIPKTIKVNSSSLHRKDIEQSTLLESHANSNVKTVLEFHKRNVPDEDEAFFISVMPSIKKLSVAEKLDFRIGVLTIIKCIIEESKRTDNASPSNSHYNNLHFVTQDDFPTIKINISDDE